MDEKALEARRAYNREYQKKWRAAHPDRAKAIQERYWAKKGQGKTGADAQQ